MHMAASSWPRAPPPFSARAIRAPFTWRAPAAPRSWVTSSWICARPDAPMGWPRDSRPPLGLMGIDTADLRRAAHGEDAALALGAETQRLGLVEFAVGGGVVHLGAVDVLRARDPLFRRRFCSAARRCRYPSKFALPAGPEHRCPDLHRLRREAEAPHRVAVAEDGRGGAVADGRAHGPGERPGHHAVRQHLLRRDREGVLRVGIQRRVEMVLGRDMRRAVPGCCRISSCAGARRSRTRP